eukprot:GHVU01211070.1.p2 GENE.GHVU01211070.1~~GHVU01211070.1.p2  ORF type:complete len:100 (-),score=9.16 GHVU01211070.1:501-800(-)
MARDRQARVVPLPRMSSIGRTHPHTHIIPVPPPGAIESLEVNKHVAKRAAGIDAADHIAPHVTPYRAAPSPKSKWVTDFPTLQGVDDICTYECYIVLVS